MEGDLNGRQPQWKTHQWKTNAMEDNINGRRPQYDLKVRRPKWKTTSMEEDINEALQKADNIRLPS